jgi:hypothetical protein
MRSFKVIMILEFLAKDVHVLVAEYDKMVQAFLLNRLNESLDVGNRIRRSNGGTMRLNLCLFEHFQKWFRVLAIVIVHHYYAWQLLVFSVLDERFGLLDHPRLVWLVSRRSEVNLPAIPGEW